MAKADTSKSPSRVESTPCKPMLRYQRDPIRTWISVAEECGRALDEFAQMNREFMRRAKR